ncbi:MAG: TetR/AcrR family transcriptional regulator [Spongiibacter sp.]|uniref:TetR/AcrR family transcriptional regulator n=1 Tax=Spongiibacter thalassae TaxID=2721624 RepID=A0ABX1GBC0_9GAMM|nr:TetR/AcrR family transcriptional regulator [Spongiibacter thalassae]MDX1504368.1 TetR/AcrR family transcriptional regulator [Spongiibacter sp.]NKI16460.1 TetR/AcrR family transcriptional regulator [Spongiibacter thalassae]
MTNARQQSKAATIELILRAAKAEFAEHGLEKANVKKIAERAGVTKQLVYHYYNSKEQLFACVLDVSSDNTMTALTALEFDHLPPVEGLRVLIEHLFDAYQRDPEMAQLATEGIRFHDSHTTPANRFIDLGPQLTEKMTKLIDRGCASGEFRSDLNPELVFVTTCLMVAGAYTNRYLIDSLSTISTRNCEDLQVWRRFTADFVLAALIAPPSPADVKAGNA